MDHPDDRDLAGSHSRVPGYTLERGISVDRAGALVAARNDLTGAPVVIRLLTPALAGDSAFRRQLKHDMDVLCALRHQYLIATIAYAAAAGAVVGEAVHAVTLAHAVGREGALDAAAALVVFDDCLAALEALHGAGVLHRDVHPDVVLLDGGGSALLRDAGIPSPPLHAGWRAGTPQYMAPELWAHQPHSRSTDLYAATGVLVEALTGTPPYPGSDLAGLSRQHAAAPVPSEIVPMLARALVVTGLAKDARDRPSDAAAVRRDVETAGVAFIGGDWRDRGRAWLATTVSALLAAPEPALPVPVMLDDDDDDDNLPLTGVSIDTAADDVPAGGVGWRVWAVAVSAVAVLVAMVLIALRTLGASPDQQSPPGPASPLFGSSASATATALPVTVPSDSSAATDTAVPSVTPTATPEPTPTPTPPNTASISLEPTATPKPTPTPTPTQCPTLPTPCL